MAQRSSGSSSDEASSLLGHQLHSSLHLDTSGDPPRGRARDNAAFQPEPHPPVQPHQIVLSTESPVALKVGTQQVIPKALAVASKPKGPARHQSFASVTLSKEAARRNPKLLPASSFSHDDLDVDVNSGGTLRRNLRNQSYRAAMKGLGIPGRAAPATQPLRALAEEVSPAPSARMPAKHKNTLGRKRPQKGSFKDDPRFYQEIRERGLNSTSHESDDDLLEDSSTSDRSHKPDPDIVVKNYRPTQVTWSKLPEVVESGILNQLSPEERKRQEAIFEIITSEYSYLHSLRILVSEFLQSKELKATMTQIENHHLFSNIADILGASQRFFEELEKRHRKNVCIEDISDILEEHANNHFQPYVAYCSNEVYQQRTLQKLTNSNPAFKEALKEIERRPACGGLPMISFLILPMQRVTRLPLLLDTICQKTQGHSEEQYKAANRALKAISKLVKQCNEGAHKMERTEQMYTLQTQLDFGKVKSFPLISASRWLLKRGELTLDSGIFRKISGRATCYLFLFNDVLIVTKKKSEESYIVMDHAKTDQIEVKKIDQDDPQPPATGKSGGGNRSSSVPYMFCVTIAKNSEGKPEKLLLSTDTLSDRVRWITALERTENKEPDLANKGGLHENQVEVTKAYIAKQADELTLQQADVVLIRQQEDRWLFGERLRDGEMGWFPEEHAHPITNPMAVERNVRRMERLRVETDV
ncbi:rho guanine nucleotide exchange factor 16 [Tachyglossus aculeatus]|uniref:rho guanine nucleotide exchange factor 16 n=1 Tax=Tachyglossus aculeatus TaxID=9261 RepID=UPI0018F47270|nr:rho guanine nucleotide exchange factor 16 [Tachyglossus aculeatus]